MIDLGKDPFGNLSSMPPKTTRKYKYHRPKEKGGKWIYIDGVCTDGGSGKQARCIANEFSKKLSECLNIRIGSYWREGVKSWFLWVPNKE